MIPKLFHHGHLIQVAILVIVIVFNDSISLLDTVIVLSLGMIYSFVVSNHRYVEENFDILYRNLK